MSPWDVLGIPEGTVDQREIRRAYAGKVKLHPPDVDPAGFTRVREAYEYLRELTREDDEETGDDLPPPQPTLLVEREGRRGPGPRAPPSEAEGRPGTLGEREAREARETEPAPGPTGLGEREPRRGPEREPAPGPTVLSERGEGRGPAPEPPIEDAPLRESRRREETPDEDVLADVRAAAEMPKGPGRDERLRAALLALADRMHGDRRLVPVWSRAVLETLDDPERPWLIASSTRQKDLVLDLFEARGEVAARVIPLLRERGHYDHLEKLARAVLEERAEPRHDVGAGLAFLAASVAIVAADLGKAIADRVFRSAARKDDAIPDWLDLDRRLAAGMEARIGKPEVRAFLAARADGLPWNQAESRDITTAAIRHIARLDPSAALRALLDDSAPGLVASADARYPPRARPQANSLGGWRWLVLVVGIAVGLFRVCGAERTTRPDTERILRDSRRVLRDADDVMRDLKEKYGYDPNASPEENQRRMREKLKLPPPVEPRSPPR